ncbi:MAG: hypothetical protein KF819_27205 [Labilithrix sp.]|nr:hypothetical protein [Labilithrix sp.]
MVTITRVSLIALGVALAGCASTVDDQEALAEQPLEQAAPQEHAAATDPTTVDPSEGNVDSKSDAWIAGGWGRGWGGWGGGWGRGLGWGGGWGRGWGWGGGWGAPGWGWGGGWAQPWGGVGWGGCGGWGAGCW